MLKLFITTLVSFVCASNASALIFGVNIHSSTGQSTTDIMKARNLKSARIDLTADSDINGTRSLASRLRAQGGTIEVTLQISYQWDNSCNQNFTKVENDSYNQTVAIVNNYKDVIYDYELLNEITLRPETQAQVTPNSGSSASAYSGKSCYNTMAAVLRGMSRAIHDVKSSSGYPLRVILGTVGRDYGFISFMQQQGVVVDVVGFHVYPHAGDDSFTSDPWYGSGGAFGQLAQFKLPVHVNEFNCGEIYDNSYDNKAGSSSTLTCLQTYKNQIPTLINQKQINLESVHMYEITDEPTISGAEGRFGLMYDLNTPKVQLYAITGFAGGTLSASEQQQVTSLGILSNADITNYKNIAGNSSPAPSPTPSSSPVVTPTPSPTPVVNPIPSPTPSGTINYASYTNTQYVTSLYRLLLGREPDSSGLNNFVAQLNQGTSTRIDVQNSFLLSSEYKARVSSNNYTLASSMNSLSIDNFVRTLYIVLLNRDADSSGLSYYDSIIAQGTNRVDVFQALINSAEYKSLFSATQGSSKRRK